MGVTVNVNKLSVVHKGSSGMAMSFPDVCKTPSPGGPVPIPYPNIAQSSDLAKGTKKVKVDGKSVMVKDSELSRSSGDEAGTLKGVVSNQNMGKAKAILYSFTVKMEGKNVVRLTDMMQTNGMSGNAINPAELQAPIPEIPSMPEECKKLKEKEKEGESIASEKSGMLGDHFNKIKKIVERKMVVLYIRGTSHDCKPWIKAYHQPKPHAIFKGNTITGDERIALAQAWLDEYREDLEEDARVLPEAARKAFVNTRINASVTKGVLLGSNAVYSTKAEEFTGVVGGTRAGDVLEPLKAVASGVRDSGRSYKGKWVTADYDLYQVLKASGKCDEVDQAGRTFSQLKKAINKSLKWDAIQHGPQAQWVANAKDVKLGAPKGTDFPKSMKEGFKAGDCKKQIDIPGRPKGMKVFDDGVTVIAPGGTLYLEEQEDTFNALKCRDCDE